MTRYSVKYSVTIDDVETNHFKMIETSGNRRESIKAILKTLHVGSKVKLIKVKKAQNAQGRLDGGEE